MSKKHHTHVWHELRLETATFKTHIAELEKFIRSKGHSEESISPEHPHVTFAGVVIMAKDIIKATAHIFRESPEDSALLIGMTDELKLINQIIAERHPKDFHLSFNDIFPAIQRICDQYFPAIKQRLTADTDQLKELTDKAERLSTELEQGLEYLQERKKALDHIENERGTIAQQITSDISNRLEIEKKELIQTYNDNKDKLEEQQESVKKIIEESNNILNLSTVAGLAKEFKRARDELNKQLNSTFWALLFSLCLFLFLLYGAITDSWGHMTIAPLGAEAEAEAEAGAGAKAGTGTEPKTGWAFLNTFFVRVSIVLPGIVLTAFALGKYAQLFRLREHYNHKYTMVVALGGFKEEAPEYADDLTALVFEQVAFDPAKSLTKTKSNSDKSLRVFEHFVQKLEEKAAQKLAEGVKNS